MDPLPYEHDRILKAMLGEVHEKIEDSVLRVYWNIQRMLEQAGMPPLTNREMLIVATAAWTAGRRANKREGQMAKRRGWENKNGFVKRGDKIFIRKGAKWYPGVFLEWTETSTAWVMINGVRREKVRPDRMATSDENLPVHYR